jgi:hypothetical protein
MQSKGKCLCHFSGVFNLSDNYPQYAHRVSNVISILELRY